MDLNARLRARPRTEKSGIPEDYVMHCGHRGQMPFWWEKRSGLGANDCGGKAIVSNIVPPSYAALLDPESEGYPVHLLDHGLEPRQKKTLGVSHGKIGCRNPHDRPPNREWWGCERCARNCGGIIDFGVWSCLGVAIPHTFPPCKSCYHWSR